MKRNIYKITFLIFMFLFLGTLFRYVSSDYASTWMLNECNDVYSFGVLLMKIVTGRSPVDYSKAPGEVYSKKRSPYNF